MLGRNYKMLTYYKKTFKQNFVTTSLVQWGGTFHLQLTARKELSSKKEELES